MATFNWPGFGIAAIKPTLDQPAQVNRSAYTGVRAVASNPWHGKWSFEVQLARKQGDANFQAIRAFFTQLQGSVNNFHLPAAEAPQNSNTGVTVAAAAAQGATSLSLTGLTTALAAGNMVTIAGQLLSLTGVGTLTGSAQTVNFQPALRAAAIAQLAAPTMNAPGTATTGGTIGAGTYYGKVTSLGTTGETTGSNEVSQVTTGTTSTITWNFTSVGPNGGRIYVGTTAGGENTYFTVPANATSYTQTAPTGTAGTVPSSNTTPATSVETAKPYALVALTTSSFSWDIASWRLYGLTFTADEDVSGTDGASPTGDTWDATWTTTGPSPGPNVLGVAVQNNRGASSQAAMLDYVGAPIVLSGSTAVLPSAAAAPQQYGAAGNSTTDDTTAVTSAASGAWANGASVYWPTGSYKVTSNIAHLSQLSHSGAGSITDGTSTFYPACPAGVTNTLFVATTGDDVNNDGISSSRPLATVTEALNRIANFGGGSCNWVISLGVGILNSAATITIDQPYSARITVQGASPVTTSLTGITSVSGVDGAYTITATATSTASMSVGQLICITATSGTGNHEVYRGCWEVLSIVNGTTFTFNCTAWYGTPPTGITGTITVMQSLLKFGAFTGVQGRAFTITNVGLKGDKSLGHMGFLASSYASVQGGMITVNGTLAVSSFGDDGVRANHGGVISITDNATVFSSNNGDNGVLARFSGSNVVCFGHVYASGNGWQNIPNSGGQGFHAQFSGHVYLLNSQANGNWGCGYLARNGGSLICDKIGSALSVRNNYGYQAGPNGGALQCATVGNARASTADNYNVLGNGSMEAASSTSASAGRHGFNNQGGYLDMSSAVVTGAAVNGVNAVSGLSMTDASSSNVSGSVNFQYHAQDGAYIRRLTPAGSPAADPAINTRGNNQAYIEG